MRFPKHVFAVYHAFKFSSTCSGGWLKSWFLTSTSCCLVDFQVAPADLRWGISPIGGRSPVSCWSAGVFGAAGCVYTPLWIGQRRSQRGAEEYFAMPADYMSEFQSNFLWASWPRSLIAHPTIKPNPCHSAPLKSNLEPNIRFRLWS